VTDNRNEIRFLIIVAARDAACHGSVLAFQAATALRGMMYRSMPRFKYHARVQAGIHHVAGN